MKKLILILSLGVFLFSCNMLESKPIPGYPKPFLMVDTTVSSNNWVIVKDYEIGHEYIKRTSNDDILIHYIDCKLCKHMDSVNNATRDSIIINTILKKIDSNGSGSRW